MTQIVVFIVLFTAILFIMLGIIMSLNARIDNMEVENGTLWRLVGRINDEANVMRGRIARLEREEQDGET